MQYFGGILLAVVAVACGSLEDLSGEKTHNLLSESRRDAAVADSPRGAGALADSGEQAGASGSANAAGMPSEPAAMDSGAPASTPFCSRISTTPGDFNPCGDTWGIAYSPDGQLLAIATHTPPPNVHIYRTSDGSLVHSLGIGGSAYAVRFSPDGESIAISGEEPGGTHALDQHAADLVKLFETRSGNELRTLTVSCGFYASALAFSLDGSQLATAGYTGAIEIWQVADGAKLTSIPYATSVHNVEFAASGAELLVGGYDARATVWEVPSGKLRLELKPTTAEMADARFSPDGMLIATTGPNNDIQVWNASDGALRQRISSHTSYVSHVLWLDRDHIVSNDWSGAITWMTRTQEDAFTVGPSWTTGGASFGLAISPDRKQLAAGGARDGSAGFELFAIDPQRL